MSEKKLQEILEGKNRLQGILDDAYKRIETVFSIEFKKPDLYIGNKLIYGAVHNPIYASSIEAAFFPTYYIISFPSRSIKQRDASKLLYCSLHELTHALQFNLMSEEYKEKLNANELTMAQKAFLEGIASYVAIDICKKSSDPNLLSYVDGIEKRFAKVYERSLNRIIETNERGHRTVLEKVKDLIFGKENNYADSPEYKEINPLPYVNTDTNISLFDDIIGYGYIKSLIEHGGNIKDILLHLSDYLDEIQ